MKTPFRDNVIPLFDLHCDTFTEAYKHDYDMHNCPLHISLDKTKQFYPYIQVGAIWSDYRFSDNEGYSHFKKNVEYIYNQNINIITKLTEQTEKSFILAVEDARILNRDLKRIYSMYNYGVRILTLNWKGINCLGGGWNTDIGLTDFGKKVVEACFEVNILIDISHSSYETQLNVFQLALKHGFIPIFTHSNSYSICNHNRNLKDNIFKEISMLGGLVGISLCPEHLTNSNFANISDIIRHIEHYLSLNGENSISLGCDFDGITSLPSKISSISDLSLLYDRMLMEFGMTITQKIFFYNAFHFFQKNL